MDSMGSSAPAQDNSRRNMIIGIVVGVLVLCCCCAVVAGAVFWACGDMIMSNAQSCNF